MARSSRRKVTDWDRLAERSGSLRRSLQELGDELKELCEKDDRDAIRGSGILRKELDRWRLSVEALLPAAEEFVRRLEREREDQAGSLDQRIHREIASRGHEVAGDGTVLVVDGLVHVEVDAKKGSVRVNGEACGGTAPSLVAETVSTEVDRISKLLTPPGRMLEHLLAAYTRELAVRGKIAGTQVDTGALLIQLVMLRQDAGFRSNPSSSNFREYPRELFRADLRQVLASGSAEIDGHRLRYASGSDTAGAVFMHVPALGRCAHVGRIWFEPAGGEK